MQEKQWNGSLFVGDLNPLYELDMHKGTDIEKSWNNLLSRNPSRIYYGHAKTATFVENDMPVETKENDNPPKILHELTYINAEVIYR